MGEIARSMTYDPVNDGDEEVSGTNKGLEFDAFFLRDLNGDGEAEGVRGICRSIGEQDTLYMELKVQAGGHFENGIITISGENFQLQTAIPKDAVVKENTIGNNIKSIKLNTINSGTQKLFSGIVTALIGSDTSNYSKKGKVTLTGNYISDNENINTPITKEVEFNIDWHGTVGAQITNVSQNQNIETAIDEENDELKLNFKISARETKGQLILKKALLEGTIPSLNDYEPIKVECINDNSNFIYNDETKEFKIERESILNEETKVVTNTIAREISYELCVTYPLEAYRRIGKDTVEIHIPLKAYFEGYNNENEEFINPETSNEAESTIIATYRRLEGKVARFDIVVGKYINGKYIVSKDKPLKIYDGVSEKEDNDIYTVLWHGCTGASNSNIGMIMKETKDNDSQVSDQFVKTDDTSESMEDVTSNIGIYFSNQEEILGQDGEIKVYDEELDELLMTFNKNNWSKYNSSNPYYYSIPVKHIRIETSKVNSNSSLYVYNIKQLNDEYIVEHYTRENFDKLQYIKSTLNGYIDGKNINEDVHNANYEVPYTIASVSINKSTLSTQETEKDMKITINASGDEFYNQVQWQNGTFLLKLPEEIIDIKINNVTAGVKILSYEKYKDGENYYIKINTENSKPTTYSISIDCDITPNPASITQKKNIDLYYYNENTIAYNNNIKDTYDINDNLDTDELIGSTNTSINFISPSSLLTSESITEYDSNGSITIAPQIAEVEKTQKTARINIQITNNYSNTISDVIILGRIPCAGNKYVINGENLDSEFNTIMQEKLTLPAELQEIAKVYYSDKIDATKDVTLESNNWQENPTDLTNIKSYLIDLEGRKINKDAKYEISYKVSIPNGLSYNQVSYSHHAVYFSLDTTEGKYPTQTEPNKVGLMIAKQYDLELIKYQKGKENTVSGATYYIKEENTEEGKTKVTDTKGKLTVNGLYVDRTYIIKEIKSPANYELNESEIKFRITEENEELKIVEDQTTREDARLIQIVNPQDGENYKVQVQVEDEVKANIKIVKTEEGTNTTLNGIRFKITGRNIENGRIITTDKNGEVILTGLSIGQEYTLEEIKTKDGYYQIKEKIVFIINNNNGNYVVELKEENERSLVKNKSIQEVNNIPTLTLNIDNEKIPEYTLKIKKVVKGEEKPLAGAKFRLYKGTEKIADYITDTQGIITIPNLYQYEETKNIDQTYKLKEILAPDGYAQVRDITFYVTKVDGVLTMQIQEGKIKEQESDNESNTVTITIEDSPSFKLIKKDGETGAPLPNTKFAIYNIDNGEQLALDSKYNILGEKEVINGKTYYTLTTNDKGEIEANLKEGLYKAVEIQANNDKYDITNNAYYFGIGISREPKEEMSIEIMASPLESNVYIQLISGDSDGGYIAGGYFTGDSATIGEITVNKNQNKNGVLIKYNENGEVIWAKNVEENMKLLSSTNDGGCITTIRFGNS